MGFFSTPKPKVDKLELKKIINELYAAGNFNEKERDIVDVTFEPYLDPSAYDNEPGIDAGEVTEALNQLRNPDSEHLKIYGIKLSEEKIKFLEERLQHYLER